MQLNRALIVISAFIAGYCTSVLFNTIRYEECEPKNSLQVQRLEYACDSIAFELEEARRMEHTLTKWVQAQAEIINYKDSIISVCRKTKK
jgi:hypothetical protein